MTVRHGENAVTNEKEVVMLKSIRTLCLALVSSVVALVAVAGPTKQDAQSLVEEAAQFAAKSGKDGLIAEVNKKDGAFNKGELYVFVYDLKGTLVADPVNPNLVGQNNLAKPDAEGKLFRKEFVEVATQKGSGWVEYKYNNPVSGKVEPKASFVKKQGDIIIIAGVYLK
jgi:signal transduction histidine kinase